MTDFKIPADPAYDLYWSEKVGFAEAAWASRSHTTELRELVARWIVEKAETGPTQKLRGLVVDAQTEVPAMLSQNESFADLIPWFASLNRSSEDDPRAEWMLGLAGADAIESSTVPKVFKAVLDLTHGPVGNRALGQELASKFDRDKELRSRFAALAAELVEERTRDPAGAVPSRDRALFSSQQDEWARQLDIRELLREPVFEIPYWIDAERTALRFLRSYDPQRYVELVAAFAAPQAASAALRDLDADGEALAKVLAAAPSAYEGGRWNQSLTAPLVLRTAVAHLERRLLGSHHLEDDELEGIAKDTCRLFADAVASRQDGPELSLRWAVNLIEELAIGLRKNGSVPPPLRSPASPRWFLLETLCAAELSRGWSTHPLDDLATDLSLVRRCAQVLAAMSRDEPETLDPIDAIIPSNSHDAEIFEAAAKFLVLAPGPEAYVYDVLGWQLAKHADPAAQWAMLWRKLLPLRDMERHRYGTRGTQPDAESVAKLVWAIGLHASWWLHGNGGSAQEAALLTSLDEAALEQTLTRYVPEPFWDAASAHAVVALARIPPQPASLANLSQALEVRASATPLFFRILHSLLDLVSPRVVWDSVEGGPERVRTLIAEAKAIGAIDPHYLQQVSGSLSAIETSLSPAERT